MDSLIEPPEVYQLAASNPIHQSNLKVAVQSALAAALCLGLPVGFLFWLIILKRLTPSAPVDRLLNFIQDNPLPMPILEMLGAFGWGYLLCKISGYRQWWWASAATMAGVRVGDYPLPNALLVEWIQRHIPAGFPVHMTFGFTLGINVLCVTLTTGLLLGLVLRNWRASLILAVGTTLGSVLAALITLVILDTLGIRVGTGNDAMPKAMAAGTLAAALAGGAILGLVFNRYVQGGMVEARTRSGH